MKALGFLILSLFVSASALACPNLVGSYTCTDEEGSEVIQLSQEVVDGVTHYVYSSSEESQTLIADGKVRPIEDDESLRNGVMSATCMSSDLKISFAGELMDNGQKVGRVAITTTVNLDDSTNYRQNTTGNVTIDGQGTFPINESMTCTRN